MILPVKNLKLICPYGERLLHHDGKYVKSYHSGIDVIGKDFTVYAICDLVIDGVVLPDEEFPAQFEKINGEWIKKDFPVNRAWTPYIKCHSAEDTKYKFVYKHVNSRFLVSDTIIPEGTRIAEYGQYGYSFGAHLHFETWHISTHFNPVDFFKFKGITV